MQVKLFEVRDRMTFIPMMAIKLAPIPGFTGNPERFESELFLLRRAGYSQEQITGLSPECEWQLKCPECGYTMDEKVALQVLADEPEIFCNSVAHPDKVSRMAKYPTNIRRKSLLRPYVVLVKLDGMRADYDPHTWTNGRTLQFAHQYIIDHWEDLESGQVLDIEFLNGETETPKVSERLDSHG